MQVHVFGARAVAQADAAHNAEALFDQGRELMSRERYADACPKFAASQRLDPALGTLLNLAYCWKQLGKLASAWTSYREAASLAYWQHQPEREAFARAEAAELEAKLARLKIRVAETDHPQLELRRDGVLVPRDVWGVEIPVDPGEYTIEAVAPDRGQFATTVSVLAGNIAEVNVPVLRRIPKSEQAAARPEAQAAAEQPPSPARAADPEATRAPPAQARTDRGSVLPALAIGVGAAGVAALGVAGFFALRMQSEDSEARKICPDEDDCSSAEASAHESHKRAAHESRTAAYVSGSIGAACVLGAVVLLLAAPSGPDSDRARSPANTVTVAAAPGELMIVARGRL